MSGTKPPTVGPHCGQVKASSAGYQWHSNHSERICTTCSESYSRYMQAYRLRRGGRATVTVDDMIRFARAWDQDRPDQRRAVRRALEAMVVPR